MKRLLIAVSAIAVLAGCTQSKPEQWAKLYEAKDMQVSGDIKSLDQQKSQGWIKQDFKTPIEVGKLKMDRFLTLSEADCNNQKVRDIERVNMLMDGSVKEGKPEDWKTIEAGKVSEAKFNWLCHGKKLEN